MQQLSLIPATEPDWASDETGNLPSGLLVPFINHSFELLALPRSRLVLLLPCDAFQKPTP